MQGIWPARFSYVLRCYGHEKVYILDGGYKKWTAESREVEKDAEEELYDYALREGEMLGYDDIKKIEGDASR